MRNALFIGLALMILPHFIGSFARDVFDTFQSGSLPSHLWIYVVAMAAVAFWPSRKEHR